MNQRGGIIAFGIVAAIVGAAIYVSTSNQNHLGLLRQFFIWIDTLVYSLSTFAYSIFYEVSSSSLLSSLNLAAASQRLYTLLGIFMLFRLAFSFIKFIINPEGMEKGTSKLLSNLAVSLALIVSVPWIFNRAFALQTYIMDSNVIGNLILGINSEKFNPNDSDTNDSKNFLGMFNASSYGQQVAFLTFSAFYHPDASIPALSDCGNLLYYYSDNLKIDGNLLDEETGVDGKPLSKEDIKIAKCVNALNNADYVIVDNAAAEIGTLFYIASQRYSIGVLTNPAVFRSYVGSQYVVDYTALVSAAAGIFLGLLFLNFSFDVAVRNVKLCFLQIIAPIPIILNIEPGDAKGDKKSLNWWTKECLKTYVDLFIRVATVYFGVFLINVLFGNGNSTVAGSTNTSNWFKVFMILGILLFVKQIPELIGKAFGIDVKGQFSLNPLKRLRENKLTGGILGAGVGLFAGAGLGGMIRGARAGAGGKKIAENMREQSEMRNKIAESNRLSTKFQANEGDNLLTRAFKRVGRSTYGSVNRGVERVNRTLGTHIGSDNFPTSANIANRLRDIDEGITGRGIKQVNEDIDTQNARKRATEEKISGDKRKIVDLSKAADSYKALEDRAQEQIRLGKGAAGAAYVKMMGQLESEKTRVITADSNLTSQLADAKAALADTSKKYSADVRDALSRTVTRLNSEIDADIAAKEKQRGENVARLSSELENNVRGAWTYGYIDEAISDSSLDATFTNLRKNAQQSAGYAGQNIDDLSGEELHKLLGATKGDIGELKRGIADSERDMEAIDEVIKKFNVEKDALQEKKKSLDASKAYADVNAQITGNPGSRK